MLALLSLQYLVGLQQQGTQVGLRELLSEAGLRGRHGLPGRQRELREPERLRHVDAAGNGRRRVQAAGGAFLVR